MSNLDSLGANTGPVSGGLRSFVVLKDSAYTAREGDSGPWRETWKHRGPIPFSIKPSKSCNLIFLTDVVPIIAHPMVVGDNKGPTGWFPRLDVARATNITGFNEGIPVQTGDKCLFTEALGREPKLIYVAKILDDIPYVDKKTQKEVTSSVRIIQIDNAAVLNQLVTLSQVDGKTAEFRHFKVTRSSNQKSSRLGDGWVFLKTLTRKQIEGQIPDAFERASKIDLDKAYPLYSKEEVIAILKLHKRIVDQHPSEAKYEMTYNTERLSAIVGGADMTTQGSGFSFGGSATATAELPNPNSLENLADIEPAADEDPFSGVDA